MNGEGSNGNGHWGEGCAFIVDLNPFDKFIEPLQYRQLEAVIIHFLNELRQRQSKIGLDSSVLKQKHPTERIPLLQPSTSPVCRSLLLEEWALIPLLL